MVLSKDLYMRVAFIIIEQNKLLIKNDVKNDSSKNYSRKNGCWK